MATVYLGLGSNVGDRLENLHFALHCLATPCEVVDVSSLYETEAVGPPQPPFYNAVCEVETSLEPLQLLSFIKAVEREAGREEGGERWGPRPLDIDILLYEDEILETPELTVPHPRLQERAFVLAPLCEIAPASIHPRLKKPMLTLLKEADQSGIQVIADPSWAEDPEGGR